MILFVDFTVEMLTPVYCPVGHNPPQASTIFTKGIRGRPVANLYKICICIFAIHVENKLKYVTCLGR